MGTLSDQRPQSDIYSGLNARSLKRVLAKQFRQAGLSFPEEDALELVMAATRLSRTDITLNGEMRLSQKMIETVSEYASRRLSAEPVDSILGWREFYGRRFKVSKDVLSPRADTETLIRCGLKSLKGKVSPTCLDLGTGSGAILISMLAEREDATGVGGDISKDALVIARENASNLGISNRAEFLTSPWFESVRGKFDLILSNPPYISDTDMDGLDKEVVQYDPAISLRGGEDGLNAYREILSQAKDYLKPDGAIWVEIGYDQAEAVCTLFEQNQFVDIEIRKDLSGQTRCVGGKNSS